MDVNIPPACLMAVFDIQGKKRDTLF